MGFLALDGTLVVQVINFIVFLMVMNVIFFRPVTQAIAARRAYIDELSSTYEGSLRRAHELRDEAGARRGAARRDADELLAKARAEAGAEAEQLSAGYTQIASTLIGDAHKVVTAEEDQARGREDELAVQLAAVIVQRTLVLEQPV